MTACCDRPDCGLPTEPGWWVAVVEGGGGGPKVLTERGWFDVGDDYEFGASYSMRGWGNPDVEWHRVDPIPLHLGENLKPLEAVPLLHMPISAPALVWLLYLILMPAMGASLAGWDGVLVAFIACGLSFQFWTFACWRGVYGRLR